ncbi:MAG: site-specific DNA-methyltransferase [Thermomicrobiales bacterium]
MRHRIERRDNLDALAAIPDRSVPLIYIDPPFNTGRAQRRTTLVTRRDPDGDRTGFGGHRYASSAAGTIAYPDDHDDYLAFLGPRIREGHRVLADQGSFYLHLDYRESHYAKVLMDEVFGRDRFMNQIIWAYDYGGRSRRRWPAKHDVILFYVKDRANYHFDAGAVDREPYMAPGLVTAAKAARGKLPTDVWWHTIVSPTGREKTGYPTQKPVGVLRRIVAASSRPDDVVLDYFAGSGTTGAAALELGRRFHLVDSQPDAVATMVRRFSGLSGLSVSGMASGPQADRGDLDPSR